MNVQRWTFEEENELLRRHQQGVAPSQLAEIHGRSEDAIDSKLRRFGIRRSAGNRRQVWSPEDDAALLSRRQAGWTVQQLAEIFERTERSVRTRLRRL